MGKYITTAFLREHSRIDTADASEEYLESLDEVAKDGKLPGDLMRAGLMLAATAYENRETESPTQLHPDPFYWHLVRRHVKYS